MAQRLASSEVDKRIDIVLDKSIKSVGDNVSGFMKFGEKNDYPQLVEKLIQASATGKSSYHILSKFITGAGFENEAINNIVVCKDQLGRDMRVIDLLRSAAKSISGYHGFYMYVSNNSKGEINKIIPMPFKNCRFSKLDDSGFCAKIGVYDNWEKDNNIKFKPAEIDWYNVYNSNPDVIAYQMNDAVKQGKEYKGQMFFYFFENDYLYPLSPFDSIYLDMDTEAQISLFKNREVRDGFKDTIIIRTVAPKNKDDAYEINKSINNMLGADAPKVLHLYDEIDHETRELKKNGAFAIDRIQTNINDKLFEGMEKSLANNIRKSIYGLPSVLIDYESGALSGVSGEAISQAVAYYNQMTKDLRANIGEQLGGLLSKTLNPVLRNNTDWTIKPLELIEVESVDNISVKKLESQSVLRGSVGGVQALIQLQQSVSSGTSTVDAAVSIIEEIYGIEKTTAARMLGNPVEQKNII
jgi:hypothetical protein